MRRAESGKVVPPDQHRRRRRHCIGVERLRYLPRQPRFPGQRRAPVDDAIFVTAPDARKARMPIVRHLHAVEHRDRCRPHPRIERLHQPERRDRLGDVDMRAHAQPMYAGIGPSCGMHRGRLTGDGEHRLFQCRLHAGPVLLPLPAHERPTVIFDRQREPRQSCVPDRTGKPRSISSALVTPRPARCTSVGRIAPSPHAIVSAASTVVPSPPGKEKGRTSAASSFTRSPAISTHAPGAGFIARISRSTSTALLVMPSSGCGTGGCPARSSSTSIINRPPSAASASVSSPAVCRSIATRPSSRTGPVSSPASICMIPTPVSASPARIARCTGAAPRQRGNNEPWTLRQPCFGASRIACGNNSP
ncbi:hypothetical protein WR25_05656 [Diploscapter pachys]|uniref:Uncharacterized protein n=1 Tax=Diploscapter pachys TaxID=2018661 RepID=A0A2A2JYF0_9BILA|nr:hypothetical protein WR25_05656 [Diploscapter pachys]